MNSQIADIQRLQADASDAAKVIRRLQDERDDFEIRLSESEGLLCAARNMAEAGRITIAEIRAGVYGMSDVQASLVRGIREIRGKALSSQNAHDMLVDIEEQARELIELVEEL